MKTQLSTVVSPETRQAYDRLVKSTGISLTDILTAAVPLLERHFRRAEMVAGYVRLDRWGDLDASAHCPECDQPYGDQPYGDLPWIAIRANGATDPPVCARCSTSE